MDFLRKLFDTSDYPPRWHCGRWTSGEGWLHISSDLLIFSAYLVIPLGLIHCLRRRQDLPYPALFWLFSAFIFSCGTTHLLEATIFWQPVYRLAGLVKLLTAVVSIACVVVLFRNMNGIIALPGLAALNRRLAAEVVARSESERHLSEQAGTLVETTRRLEAAQELAAIGDWSYDPRSEEISWSSEVFRLYERDPALGPPRDFAENLRLYPPETAEVLAAAVHAAVHAAPGDRRTQEVALRVVLPSGRTVWHHATITSGDEGGRLQRLSGTVQDVTDRKEHEQVLSRQREELKRSNADLERFAYVASHDLQEPLRKVRFFADMLKEGCGDREDEGVRMPLQRIDQAIERMQERIDALLEFSRAGRTVSIDGDCDLAGLLVEVVDLVRGDLERDSGRIVILPGDYRVPADRVLIRQVMQNLIGNAVKYRHPQRPLVLRISAERARELTLTFADNGRGFDPSRAERIFEPFERLHGDTDIPGTGIGLSICRRIVEAHGGTLTATAQVEVGATFTLVLPLGETP